MINHTYLPVCFPGICCISPVSTIIKLYDLPEQEKFKFHEMLVLAKNVNTITCITHISLLIEIIANCDRRSNYRFILMQLHNSCFLFGLLNLIAHGIHSYLVSVSIVFVQICFWLIENNLRVLIAACDTFRAGAVEQLRTHTRHLNALHPSDKHGGQQMVQLYEKGYGKIIVTCSQSGLT